MAAGTNGNITMNNNRAGDQGSRAPDISTADEWIRFAAVLATMPDLTERLAAAHTPTPDGRWCTACTSPGQGTPHREWPCVIAALAAEAAARA
jgi:hypothetical protein